MLLRATLAIFLLFFATSCGKQDSRRPQEPGPAEESGLLDSLPVPGVYNNAVASPAFLMIDGAKSTIDIEVYEMTDANIRGAIRRALARGVRIRVIKESNPVDDRCKIFGPAPTSVGSDCDDEKRLRSEILARGGAFIPFNKAALCVDTNKPCFEHGKMIISDRRVVLISTGNLNPTNLCDLALKPSKCNRDFTVILRDPDIVKFFGGVFEGDFQGKPYDLQALIQAAGVEGRVTVSPLSLAPLLKFIQSAESSILLHNQYLKDPTLNAALIDAARRGVRVQITLASLCSFGPPSATERQNATHLFSQFAAAGAVVRMMPSQFKIRGKPGYMHAKSIVVDGKTAWVGSVNGSTTALKNNREFGVFFQNPEWVGSLEQVMADDHSSKDSESWSESLNCALDKLDTY